MLKHCIQNFIVHLCITSRYKRFPKTFCPLLSPLTAIFFCSNQLVRFLWFYTACPFPSAFLQFKDYVPVLRRLFLLRILSLMSLLAAHILTNPLIALTILTTVDLILIFVYRFWPVSSCSCRFWLLFCSADLLAEKSLILQHWLSR